MTGYRDIDGGGLLVVGPHVTYSVLIVACHAFVLIFPWRFSSSHAKKGQNHSGLGRA